MVGDLAKRDDVPKRAILEPWTRDIERIDRELSGIREDIRRIDEHGTRGILPLSVQVAEVLKDVAKLETTLERRLPSGPNWKAVVAYVSALAPVYAFIIQQLLQRGHP